MTFAHRAVVLIGLALLAGVSCARAQTSVHQSLQVTDGGAASLAMKPVYDEMSVEGTRQADSVPDAPVIGTPGVMSLHGSVEVTSAGAARVTIPLFGSPAAGGIAPQLALVYNSQSGQGSMGQGWSLTGLSMITRCAATVAEDGWTVTNIRAPGGINWASSSNFCLDGQRLVPVSGTQGSTASEYRTEIDTHVRVLAYDANLRTPQDPSNPGYFIVQEPSGATREYGNAASVSPLCNGNSPNMLTNGLNTPKTWAWGLDNVSDPFGNNYVVCYVNLNGSQVFAASDIFYNATSANAYNTHIHFDTDTSVSSAGFFGRSDPILVYKGGNGAVLRGILSCVTVTTQDLPSGGTSNGPYVSQYRLFYDSNTANQTTDCTTRTFSPSSHALLQNIQFCAANARSGGLVCQPTNTVLTYSGSSATPDNLAEIYNSKSTGQPGIANGSQVLAGDFFGNGMDGLLVVPPSGNTWQLYKANGSGFVSVSSGSLASCGPAASNARFVVADLDGSGKDWFVVTGSPAVMNSYNYPGSMSTPAALPSYGLFRPTFDSAGNTSGFACAGSGVSVPGSGTSPSWTDNIFVGDFGGLGKVGVLTTPIGGLTVNYSYTHNSNVSYYTYQVPQAYGAQIFVLNASGTGLTSIASTPATGSTGPVGGDTITLGNFLGDDATSILSTRSGGWALYSFNGNASSPFTQINVGTDFNAGCQIYAGNFGGDGLSSLLMLPANGSGNCAGSGTWRLYRATGLSLPNGGASFTFQATAAGHPSSGDTILIGDFNADGIDDVFAAYATGYQLFTGGAGSLTSVQNSQINPTGLMLVQTSGGPGASGSNFVAGSFMPHVG